MDSPTVTDVTRSSTAKIVVCKSFSTLIALISLACLFNLPNSNAYADAVLNVSSTGNGVITAPGSGANLPQNGNPQEPGYWQVSADSSIVASATNSIKTGLVMNNGWGVTYKSATVDANTSVDYHVIIAPATTSGFYNIFIGTKTL